MDIMTIFKWVIIVAIGAVIIKSVYDEFFAKKEEKKEGENE